LCEPFWWRGGLKLWLRAVTAAHALKVRPPAVGFKRQGLRKTEKRRGQAAAMERFSNSGDRNAFIFGSVALIKTYNGFATYQF
jgi:hypothetical protein